MSNSNVEKALDAERSYIAHLYERLDEERREAEAEIESVLRNNDADTPHARMQRQAAVDRLSRRAQALKVAGNGLCFGRTDDESGTVTYIGRIGILDEDNDYEPLLVDWRAPAGRPFYCATGARPEGLVRRRHFRTRGRTVLAFHDDVFDATTAADDGGGDTALLAALNAPRDGRMHDIVSTIQAEQDEIIRLGPAGVVVIEGGPGTGKTVVALHRVAYLLYNHRDRLAQRGVLVVGPNEVFLSYVGAVLPSLGETSVVFATPGTLVSGLNATAEDSARVRRIKGSASAVDLVRAAVADRQELPSEPIPVDLSHADLRIDSSLVSRVRRYTRDTGMLHNDARVVFRERLIEGLANRVVNQVGKGWLDKRDIVLTAELRADARAALAESQDVDAAVDRLWPFLTPEQLLADLFSNPARITAATPGMGLDDRQALYRERGDAWTVSDVPLLDEAVEFLGVDRTAERRVEREQRDHVHYTRGVLQILDVDEPDEERYGRPTSSMPRSSRNAIRNVTTET